MFHLFLLITRILAWDTCEQILFAALDCNQLDLAQVGLYVDTFLQFTKTPIKECLLKLQNQFHSSTRVNRLKGMLLEAQGKWREANELYTNILKDDPTDSVCYTYTPL